MKLTKDNTKQAEKEVNKFIKRAMKPDDVMAFVGIVIRESGKAETIIAANPHQMMMIATQLMQSAREAIVGDDIEPHGTLQ